MKHIDLYSDPIGPNGLLKDIGAVPTPSLAKMLIEQQLSGNIGSYPLAACKISFFLNRVRREIGPVVSHDMLGRNMVYSAALGPENPPSEFVSSACHFVRQQPEFIQRLDHAKRASGDVKMQKRMRAGMLALTGAAAYAENHILASFAWWQDGAMASILGLSALLIPSFAKDTYADAISDLKKTANQLVVHHWATQADETTITLSLRNAYAKAPMDKIDLADADPQEVSRFIEEAIHPSNPPNSLSISVYSANPALAGTSLVLKPEQKPPQPR